MKWIGYKIEQFTTRFNDFATEIQTRVDNIERGVKIGETQKENEYKNIREEFNTFLSILLIFHDFL